jgi:hypothetical protein
MWCGVFIQENAAKCMWEELNAQSKIWSFHGGDYEECVTLCGSCKNGRSSEARFLQEPHGVTAQKTTFWMYWVNENRNNSVRTSARQWVALGLLSRGYGSYCDRLVNLIIYLHVVPFFRIMDFYLHATTRLYGVSAKYVINMEINVLLLTRI